MTTPSLDPEGRIRAVSPQVEVRLQSGGAAVQLQIHFIPQAECIDISGVPESEVDFIRQCLSDIEQHPTIACDIARDLLTVVSQLPEIQMIATSTRRDGALVEELSESIRSGEWNAARLADLPPRLQPQFIESALSERRYSALVEALPGLDREHHPRVISKLLLLQQAVLLSEHLSRFGPELRRVVVQGLLAEGRGDLLLSSLGVVQQAGEALDPLELCWQAAAAGPTSFRKVIEQWGTLTAIYGGDSPTGLGNALVQKLLNEVAKGHKSAVAVFSSGEVAKYPARWQASLTNPRDDGPIRRCIFYEEIDELLQREYADTIPADRLANAVRSRNGIPPAFILEHADRLAGDVDELIATLIDSRFLAMFQENAPALLERAESHSKTAAMLIQRGYLPLLKTHIADFKGLGKDVLLALLSDGENRFVQEFKDRFALDPEDHVPCATEIIRRLKTRGSGIEAASAFRVLKNLPATIVPELLSLPRKAGEHLLPQIISSFAPDSHTVIARELLQRRRAEVVERILPTLKKLEPDIMVQLLDVGYVRSVFENIGAFQSLDEPHLSRVIEVLGRRLAQGDVRPFIESIDRIPAALLTPFEAEHRFIGFQRDVGLPQFVLYEEYRGLLDVGDTAGIASLKGQIETHAEMIFSPDAISPERASGPLYRAVVEQLAPHHGTGRGGFARVHALPDRTSDVAKFGERGVQSVQIGSGVTYMLSQPRSEYDGVIAQLERVSEPLIDRVATAANSAERDAVIRSTIPKDYQRVRIEARSIEDELYQHLVRAARGDIPGGVLREALLCYTLATVGDARGYAQHTQDRAVATANPEYAALLEWRDLFGRMVRESSAMIVHRALQHGDLLSAAQDKYEEFARAVEKTRRLDELKRRGAASLEQQAHLLSEVSRIARSGQSAEVRLREIDSLLHTRQSVTGSAVREVRTVVRKGPGEAAPRIERIIGRIEGLREEILELLHSVGQTDIELSHVHLASLHLADFVRPRTTGLRPTFDRVSFSGLLVQASCRLFSRELQAIDTQLGKLVPREGGDREKTFQLESVITKNRAAAHIAANAGLCIGEDPFVWNSPGHFRLGLRRRESRRWEGGALLWDLSERAGDLGGRRVLLASPNPTSTLLYRVDGRELFRAMARRLISFAEANGFDAVGVSTTAHMRTNRSGTDFELELVEEIQRKNVRLQLAKPYQISGSPEYFLEGIDLLWSKH